MFLGKVGPWMVLGVLLLGFIPFVSHNASATAPTITNYGILVQTTGTATGEAGLSTFLFFLTYTDADNDSPSAGYPKGNKVIVTTQQTYPAFAFLANDTGDTNVVDGKAYYYSWSYFPVLGQMFWSFRVKSGADAEVVKLLISSTQNFPASVTSRLYPDNNDPGEKVFTLNYTNLYASAPFIMKVNIDGTNYSMSKNNTGDVTYTDGCDYYFEINLTAGLHNYTYYWQLFNANYPLHTTGPQWLLLEDEPGFQISFGAIMLVGLIALGMLMVWGLKR
jgi:hypothetical protein